MKRRLGAAVLLVGLMAVLLHSSENPLHAHQNRTGDQRTIVVTVNKAREEVSYEVDSKPVQRLLDSLGGLVSQRGEDCPVIVILPRNASFRDESDVEIMASKAGFKNVRSFLYTAENGFMTEIKWGRSIRFTTNPPPDEP